MFTVNKPDVAHMSVVLHRKQRQEDQKVRVTPWT